MNHGWGLDSFKTIGALLVDGDDRVWGSAGADIVFGEAGTDELWGCRGSGLLYGGEGDDVLYGDAGYSLDPFFEENSIFALLGYTNDGADDGFMTSAGLKLDATDSIAIRQYSMKAGARFDHQSPASSILRLNAVPARRTTYVNLRCRIKRQQMLRWQAQGLCQTANVDQCNIALPTLHGKIQALGAQS